MGDAAALELLQQSGRRVGQMLAALVNFFNPSLIVIGGGVANAGDAYLAAIREVIYARSMPLATRDLAIQLSSLGTRAGVTGAAAMVLDELFSPRAWVAGSMSAGPRAPRSTLHEEGAPTDRRYVCSPQRTAYAGTETRSRSGSRRRARGGNNGCE